jgi:hypothetical protein
MRVEGNGENAVEKYSVVSTPTAATSSPGGDRGDRDGILFEENRGEEAVAPSGSSRLSSQ